MSWVEPRTWTDDEPMHAAAFNEISDSLTFLRFRKIWVPTGVADNSRFLYGQITIDANTLATATGAVTFSVAMPSSDPCIVHTPVNTTIYGTTHESVSSTGFTMRIREIEDRTLDVNIPVNWWAFDASTTGGGTTWTAPRRWTAETVTDTLLDTEWKDHFDWLKRQLLEVNDSALEGIAYRHGTHIFDGRGADFEETITFDFAFGTQPNIQTQGVATSVYLPFVGSVSATGLKLSIRHINESVVTVKQLRCFWLGVG